MNRLVIFGTDGKPGDVLVCNQAFGDIPNDIFNEFGIGKTAFGHILFVYPFEHRVYIAGCARFDQFNHVRVTTQTPAEFRQDVERTKRVLEDICGTEVIGFRAASFSIGVANLWALDLLEEAGYRYSSSINPLRHDHYGSPSLPRLPFPSEKGDLLEGPISTIPLLGNNLPCGGGGYFRILPYRYFRWAIRRLNDGEKRPAVAPV